MYLVLVLILYEYYSDFFIIFFLRVGEGVIYIIYFKFNFEIKCIYNKIKIY